MISSIVHLSDIHIRIGDAIKSRYQEYNTVFSNLFASLAQHSSIKDKTALIVITGDIFHHKNKVEPYALELAITLLQGVAALAPVYIIRGNHDYRQDLPTEHDMITALMSYHIDNVTYLDKTGFYNVNNISIGLVAIQDTLLYGSTSGISSNLPTFPVPPKAEIGNYNIALFHGSISGSTLQNGTAVHPTLNGYPIEWFQGYDAILLGDIHVQQIKRSSVIECKKDSLSTSTHSQTYSYSTPSPWGYPGSLIQQDFGESIFGHGYIIWDLQNKQIHTYHVHNTFGFVKLRLQDHLGQIEILHRDISNNPIFVPIETVISEKWFPSTIHVSITGLHCNVESINHVSDYFQKHGRTILQMKRPSEVDLSESKMEETTDTSLTKINSLDLLIEYIQNTIQSNKVNIPDIWKVWLKHPENMILSVDHLPETISKKISDKSDKIMKLSSKYIEDFERVQSKTFVSGSVHFHYMEWSWILNYKQSNRFNFDTHESTISILNSKNGHGKSNFLETICISLFGEGFPSRYNKNYSAGIICDKKPHGVMASTVIVFTLNGKKYTLKRVLKNNNDKRAINFFEVVLSEHNADTLSILHQGQNAVSQWIDSTIGSVSTYLMSAMLSQNADSDFFSLDKSKQKILLDQILSLDHINSLQLLLKSSVLYYKSVSELIESYYDGISQKTVADPIVVQKLASSKSELLRIQSDSKKLHSEWCHVPESKLYTVRDISTLQNDYHKLQSKIAEIPSYDTDHTIEYKNELIVERSSYQKSLSALHPFSDLKHHFAQSLTNTISVEKICCNFLDILEEHKNSLESHPYFNKSDFNLYANIDFIFKHIQGTSFPLEDDNTLYTIVSEFKTWDKIHAAKFTEDIISFQNNTERTLRQLQNGIDEFNKILEDSTSNIKSISKNSTRLKKQIVKLRKEKELLSENRPNRPNVTSEWLEGFKHDIALHGTLEDAITRRDSLTRSIQQIPVLCHRITSLQSKINDIDKYIAECTDIPFNAKCSSCKKQGWKIKHDSYLKELPELHTALDSTIQELQTHRSPDLELSLTPETYLAYISELNRIVLRTTQYISSYEIYTQQNVLYGEYTHWNTLHDTLKNKLDPLETEYDSYEKQLKHHNDIIAKVSSDKYSHESKLAHIQLRRSEYNAYQSEYQRRHKEYTLAHDKLVLSWFHKLYRYRETITLSIDCLNDQIEIIDKEINDVTIAIQHNALKTSLTSQASHLRTLLDAYPSWTAWKESIAKEKDLSLLVRELETQLRGTSSQPSDQSHILRIIENAKQYTHIASWLGSLFEDYRKWLYTSYIAPMIHSKVNNVLSMISDDTLLLDSDWLDAIDTLSWFIKNGSSRVIIEKASGFQRFIVGIAIRVTFHQIGFCRIRYNQLFIDEGFTTCDADNLDRVPSFLKGLLQFYNSIYLVTHLEDLKSCTDHHIYITRDSEGLSQIQHGPDNYSMVVHTEPIKKRGRPPKSKVIILKE
jgi:DNA repair exonuclease SbcCD ATPase subunit/DNA repair exonuclease SbcCD nuclease subunit